MLRWIAILGTSLLLSAQVPTNREDAARLAELAGEINAELRDGESGVVSVKMIRKLDDIEKLARSLRGRLKRN